MKKFIGFFLLFLLPLISFSQLNSDSIYVLNYNGTELFEKPFFDSKILDNPKLNSVLLLLENRMEDKVSKTISGVVLKGHWQKVRYNGNVGFVFSGDCSKYNCLLKNKFDGYDLNYFVLFGKRIGFKKVERTIKTEGKKIVVQDEITLYERGEYIYTQNDGCFNHLHIFKELSFNEVFHIMIARHTFVLDTIMGIEYETPKLKGLKNQTYTFTGTGATGEIKITIKNNCIELYSCDCD